MSVKNRFILFGIILTAPIFLIAVILLIQLDGRDVEQQFREHTEVIARFAGASRAYVKETLRPALSKVSHDFVLEGQSSTYVANGIFKNFNHYFPDFTYQQLAENPLNPANKAHAFGSDLIHRFRQDSTLKQLSGYGSEDGKPFFYVATPEKMEAGCLECHGDPEKAPKEIRDVYGVANGYGWPVGEIVSTTLIKVPMQREIAARHTRYLLLGGSVLSFFIFLTWIIAFLFKAMVQRRLDEFLVIMNEMAKNPSGGKKLPESRQDEFGAMARAFNAMADSVRELTQDLAEKVRSRTQELQEKMVEQEKSTQEIQTLAWRNNLILQAISEGIYGVDPSEKTTFINNAGAAMIGWQASELIGQQQHEVMHHTKMDGTFYPNQECPICLTSKDGQFRTTDNEIFWRKDGSSFPVEYTATPMLENGELQGSVVVFRDISERLKTTRFNQQLLMHQRVVNAIHKISYDSIPLNEQLEKALEEILTIPWFFNQSKGVVFLVNDADQTLEMVAQKGLEEVLLTDCAKVSFGKCLCGRSAQTNTFLHASGVDDRHDVTFAGIQDHGHYIVPLVSAQRVIGILNLYLDHGHARDDQEESALHIIGHAMARLIERRQAEESLLFRNADLEEKVRIRTRELQENVKSLKDYQHQLIHSERMAALGGMVAGIAHEINTPIGIGFTSATYLKSRTQSLKEIVESDAMTYEKLYDYLDVATESSDLIEANLKRASELIKSFKMVAVDQTSQELRGIDLKNYLNEILLSLRPKFRNTKHSVVVNCAGNQRLETYPGVIAQILTNLVMNSFIHGFEGLDEGKIIIDAVIQENEVVLTYRDNGKGMNAEGVKRLFEPFFTTRRGQGGSGLGMHVVYNQVHETLKGTISCQSSLGEGTIFVIKFPSIIQGKQLEW